MRSSVGEAGAMTVRVFLAGRACDRLAGLQGLLASRGNSVELVLGELGKRPLPDPERFDLVVLDLTSSGPDLREMLECAKAPSDAELVIVGGNLGYDGLLEVLGRRTFHFVKKLGGTNELVAAMEAALRQWRLRMENRALRARLEHLEQRKAAERLTNFQAYHDLLTRLPNRALFNDRLELAIARAQRNERKLALMFLDLDGFKTVNDSLGHDLGDRLLKAVAERLQGCIRRSDTLARFGGDEFALLLPDVRAREDAAAIAEKILGGLNQHFVFGGRRLSIGASIGIAMYPGAGESGDTLIRKADIAMYHVKGQGKRAYRFYSREMERGHPGQLATERELCGGLVRGELEVYYRPRVNLATGRITAVAAVCGWRHPRSGLVEFADSVPVFATGRHIAAVDDFLYKQAFRQVVEWRHGSLAELRVVVNLPVARLGESDLVRRFAGNLLAAGLDPAAVTMQIDENAVMEGAELVGPQLQELQNLGVRLVVGDFGMGFSSLRCLERLAITGLQLSASLVRDLRPIGLDLPDEPEETPEPEGTTTINVSSVRDTHPVVEGAPGGAPEGTPTPSGGTATLPTVPGGTPTANAAGEGTPTPPGGTPTTAPDDPVRGGTPAANAARTVTAIAAAAKVLGLDLIAAGVETPEQIRFLKSCGCREAEGAVFSRALPATEVQDLLNDNPFAPLVGV